MPAHDPSCSECTDDTKCPRCKMDELMRKNSEFYKAIAEVTIDT